MIYVIAYGLLAFGTACIAIAPRTKTLWKIGLIFLFNWAINILLYAKSSPELTPYLSSGLDVGSALGCYLIYEIYKCNTAKAVMTVFIVQVIINLHLTVSDSPYMTLVALNALFILNAIIIIVISIRRLTSKNRRQNDINCYKYDRRLNSKHESRFEVHYA